jgi:hypothetical protein
MTKEIVNTKQNSKYREFVHELKSSSSIGSFDLDLAVDSSNKNNSLYSSCTLVDLGDSDENSNENQISQQSLDYSKELSDSCDSHWRSRLSGGTKETPLSIAIASKRILIRQNLRELCLQQAKRQGMNVVMDPCQAIGPRSFVFETRPGRPWRYEIDAPMGHGVDAPIPIVSAVETLNNDLLGDSSMGGSEKPKKWNKLAKMLAEKKLASNNKTGLSVLATMLQENDYVNRKAVRVSMEMVSLSSRSDDYCNYDDVTSSIESQADLIIPMFAPIDENPPRPIVEISKAEEKVRLERRKERRQSGFLFPSHLVKSATNSLHDVEAGISPALHSTPKVVQKQGNRVFRFMRTLSMRK